MSARLLQIASRRAAQFALLGFALFAGGCVTASGGFAASSVPTEGRTYDVIGPAETTVSWWALDMGVIGLPLGEPPVAEAERRLLQETGGDALINLRYWNDRSVFLLMLTRHRFHLKADAIRFTDGPAR